jgi:hypothetical protein
VSDEPEVIDAEDIETHEGGDMLPAVRPTGTLTTGGEALTPAEFQASLNDEAEMRRMLVDWIRSQLIPGEDYGIVHRKIGKKGNKQYCPHQYEQSITGRNGQLVECPRCHAKHTLRKGGAEKVLALFRCAPRFQLDQETQQAMLAMGEKCLPYICLATSIKTGCVLAEGRGSASMTEYAMDANKCIKMAKKRAMVDAALSFGLSSVFTQDIESPRDYGDHEPVRKPATKPAPVRTDPEPTVEFETVGEDVPLGTVTKLQDESEWTDEGGNRKGKFVRTDGWKKTIWTVSNPEKHKWGVGTAISGRIEQDTDAKVTVVAHIRKVGGPDEGGGEAHGEPAERARPRHLRRPMPPRTGHD